MEIGKNIAEIRKKRGLTQEELGAKLGVTNQAVSKWENQTSLPDVMLLPEIAAALGVTLNDLYGIEGRRSGRMTFQRRRRICSQSISSGKQALFPQTPESPAITFNCSGAFPIRLELCLFQEIFPLSKTRSILPGAKRFLNAKS